MRILGLSLVGIVVLLAVITPNAQAQLKHSIELLDPENDAYGPGTYELPLAGVYRENGAPIPGLFDLRKLTFAITKENVIFRLELGALGENVWGGPCGFSLEIVEVYVDCKPGGKTDAFYPTGPRVKIDQRHPWDFAVQATGWYTPDQTGRPRNWLVLWMEETPILNTIKIWTDPENNAINISVPLQALEPLGTIPEGYPWHLVVLVGSQDGFGDGSWRVVFSEAEVWHGGGADQEAFMAGVAPNVYDILTPEGVDQREVLNGYNLATGEYAEVPAVCLMPELLKLEEAKEVKAEITPYLSVVVACSGFTVGVILTMAAGGLKREKR